MARSALTMTIAITTIAAAVSANKKNVLFLLEDDGGMWATPYGDSQDPTPNLARLAAMGTVFDSAYTTVSSCSPSRASILSGLPTHQSGQYGLAHAQEHFISFDGIQSLPNLLTAAGYATGIIGKYHVWTAADYAFTWGNAPNGPGGCQTGASYSCPDTDYNLVSRNITYILQQARAFLDYAAAQDQPFFLYVGFGDSHRCGAGAQGEFCQYYGWDGGANRSTIPDWTPRWFEPANLTLPYWIQDTPIARQDLAYAYTVKNRMDQGIGLLLNELSSRGLLDDTLIISFADNGAPFTAGKTNFYEPGAAEPLIIAAPGVAGGARTSALASSLDFLPTILDYAGIPLPTGYSVLGNKVTFTGKSLMPLLGQRGSVDTEQQREEGWVHPLLRSREQVAAQAAAQAAALAAAADPAPLPANYSRVYGSFQLHEIQEYYPMRSVHAAPNATSPPWYVCIYNIAWRLTYPIASDLWTAPSLQDLITRNAAGQPTHWYRNISDYLGTPRPQYELYDLRADPQQLNDVSRDPAYASLLTQLQADIKAWQMDTADDFVIKYTHE